MKALSLGLVAAVLLVPACSGFIGNSSTRSTESAKAPAIRAAATHHAHKIKPQKADEAETASARPARAVGDYFVERFSGSFRRTPLTLTEEVVAAEGDLLVIDYTLEETGNPKVQHLRTRFNPASGRVEKVSILDGERELPAPLSAYDRLMEKTSFAADSNDGMIGAAKQTCLVGGREMDCETKDYKVSVGDTHATLSVTTSAEVNDRDVAGQIVTGDGNVVYRAELVDMRRGAGSSVASNKPFMPEQP
jgi:hypothetical protein